MAISKNKILRPSDLVKPTKTHYNRWVKRCQGVLCAENEKICESRLTTIHRSLALKEFHRHEPSELALSYGFKNGLIKTGEIIEEHWCEIYFTEKGFIEIESLKSKTCIFTGRRFA